LGSKNCWRWIKYECNKLSIPLIGFVWGIPNEDKNHISLSIPLIGFPILLDRSQLYPLSHLSIPLIGFVVLYIWFNAGGNKTFNSPYWVPPRNCWKGKTYHSRPFNSPYWVLDIMMFVVGIVAGALSIPLIGFWGDCYLHGAWFYSFNSPYWVRGSGIRYSGVCKMQLSIPLIGFRNIKQY